MSVAPHCWISQFLKPIQKWAIVWKDLIHQFVLLLLALGNLLLTFAIPLKTVNQHSYMLATAFNMRLRKFFLKSSIYGSCGWIALSNFERWRYLSLALSLLSLDSPCVVGLMNIWRNLVFYHINFLIYKQMQGLKSKTKKAKKIASNKTQTKYHPTHTSE